MKLLLTLCLALSIPFGAAKSIHDFKVQALNSDKEIKLSDFKGKKLLVVNVASKCGYTPQYEGLQKLYETYGDKLAIVGFPCDQFLGQELDEEQEIAKFCKLNYGVTFPLSAVIEVKGDNQHPIYSFLTSKEQNGKGDYKVTWNFNKFLLDEEGQLIEYFGSGVKPMSDDILKHLK